jgi:hypothetical protein
MVIFEWLGSAEHPKFRELLALVKSREIKSYKRHRRARARIRDTGRTIPEPDGRRIVRTRRRRDWGLIGLVLTVFPSAIAGPADGAVTAKDMQVIGRALTFLEGAPKVQAEIGVLVSPNDPASAEQASALQRIIGAGLVIEGLTLTLRLVPLADLSSATGLAALIVTADDAATFAAVEQVGPRQKLLTIGTDLICVQKGACVMGARSDPKIEIFVNKPLAAAAGVAFKTAFRLMIKEIQPDR